MGNALTCFDACLGPAFRPQPRYVYAMPAGLLEEGSRVIVRDLQNAAHHNGKEGVVRAYEPHTGRYLVALPDTSTISVKLENLLPSIGVTISDLKDRADLNGRVGRIVGETDLRYHISVAGGPVISLSPANVLLPRGSVARLVGLQNAPQYNGMVGHIADNDRDAKRYVVQLGANHQLRVRYDNARL